MVDVTGSQNLKGLDANGGQQDTGNIRPPNVENNLNDGLSKLSFDEPLGREAIWVSFQGSHGPCASTKVTWKG